MHLFIFAKQNLYTVTSVKSCTPLKVRQLPIVYYLLYIIYCYIILSVKSKKIEFKGKYACVTYRCGHCDSRYQKS